MSNLTLDNSSYIGNTQSCSGHFREYITHCNFILYFCRPFISIVTDFTYEEDIHHSILAKKKDVQAIHQHEEDNWLDESSFYISMVIGFITSFWLFWATLLVKTSWRHVYMRYLNKTGNNI